MRRTEREIDRPRKEKQKGLTFFSLSTPAWRANVDPEKHDGHVHLVQ